MYYRDSTERSTLTTRDCKVTPIFIYNRLAYKIKQFTKKSRVDINDTACYTRDSTKDKRKDYNNMRVTNLTSPRTGAKVANQFMINDDMGNEFFQSYETLIAKINTNEHTLVVGDDYNYSNTTSKYFKQWLKEWYWTDEEIDGLKKLLTKAKLGDTLCVQIGNIEYTVEYREV